MEISKKTRKVLRTIFKLGLDFSIPLIMLIIISVFMDTPKINLSSVALLVAAFFLYIGLMKIRDAIEENKKESDQ